MPQAGWLWLAECDVPTSKIIHEANLWGLTMRRKQAYVVS